MRRRQQFHRQLSQRKSPAVKIRTCPKASCSAARPLVLGLLLGLASLTGCKKSTPLERGENYYVRLCSSCHGMSGRPASRMPGFERKPQDLTSSDFHSQRQDEQLLFVIRNGKDRMPAFGGVLKEEQLKDVLLYIRGLPPHEHTPAVSSE